MEPLELDLPLRTIRNESLYWKVDVPNNGRSNFKLIIVCDGTAEADGSYIIPEYEYPGLIKVRLFHVFNNAGCRYVEQENMHIKIYI